MTFISVEVIEGRALLPRQPERVTYNGNSLWKLETEKHQTWPLGPAPVWYFYDDGCLFIWPPLTLTVEVYIGKEVDPDALD